MKRMALIGILAAVAAVAMVGCDWETGDDATSWSDSYNWVNFSGTYTPFTGNNNVIEKPGIKSIAVTHVGQNLQMRDSSGNYYDGYVTWIQSESGVLPTTASTNGPTYPRGEETDRVLAQFKCTGGGATLVGTFEGYQVNNVLRDRVILGTWVKGSQSDTLQGAAPAMVLDTRPTDSAFSQDGTSTTGSQVVPDVVEEVVVPAP
jgi:hypothetical protein